MKIAFYGSSLLSSYWNGAATYYRGMLRDLAGRGYLISFYEADAFDRQRHRDIEPPDWARSIRRPTFRSLPIRPSPPISPSLATACRTARRGWRNSSLGAPRCCPVANS